MLSRICFCVPLLLIASCGDEGHSGQPDAGGTDATVEPDATSDPSAALFRADHVLEIDIKLDPHHWELLRQEPEDLLMPKVTCDDQPTERPYHYFPGDITIDGVSTLNVGVRKKGGFGSISSSRPSLKIKAHEYVAGQRIFGLHRLTLNNNRQDPSQISQCLGYGLFGDARVPSSRCAYAHVTVNGEDLGLYSNVETLKKNFLARHFIDETGRLYESGGDFLPGATGGFQPKTSPEDPDCGDLPPVVEALRAPDENLLERLDAVVDVDRFLTYWGMEVITGHWDSYSNNRNNYFFYHDPTSDKMHFIPWGLDSLFTDRPRTTRPQSVYACGAMAWRLYDVPETRDLYLGRLRDLLDDVWDEGAILAEIDRMEELIAPIVNPRDDDASEVAKAIDRTRSFVVGRRDVLLGELDAGPPVWPYPAEESCLIRLGTVTATFDAPWDSLDNFAAGTGTMGGTVAGVDLTSDSALSSAGPSEESQALIRVFAPLTDGRLGVVLIIIQDIADVFPRTLPIDLGNVAAIMTFYDPDTDTTSGGGLILGGTLTLTSASTVPDEPIIGTITGDVLEM